MPERVPRGTRSARGSAPSFLPPCSEQNSIRSLVLRSSIGSSIAGICPVFMSKDGRFPRSKFRNNQRTAQCAGPHALPQKRLKRWSSH